MTSGILHKENIGRLNESCRIIIGCSKQTISNKLYHSVAEPHRNIIRRATAEEERKKCNFDEKHPLHTLIPRNSKLN